VTQDTRADHARYIANWLQLWRAIRRRFFIGAAAAANRAVEWLHGKQPCQD